jgi:peptidoglycan/xylan/chitin deacetylase (PgdA/CDA1 family)
MLSDDGSLVIYLFHGVVESCDYEIRNYTRKHLTATQFRDMVGAVAAVGQALSMDEVLEFCVSKKTFPKRAFAVTFDDGFENNSSIARPILEDLKVPATVYVTTRFIDENGMSWIDKIEWAFERVVRGSLRMPWRDSPVEFFDRSSKLALLTGIRQYVKANSVLDVSNFVSTIFKELELKEVRSSEDQLDKKMSWQQVRDWIAPGYTIGGHSHTHPILSFLSPEKLAWEIDTSVDLLRSKADIVSQHYSYPEGLAHCYSPEVIEALKLRGIRCSPTAVDGINPPGTDSFHLRRVMVC